MNKIELSLHRQRARVAVVVAALVLGFGGSGGALAGVADIAPAPIFTATTSTTEVKPNVMFVLDDSGSMAWPYMPDNAADFLGNYGFPSSQCNGVYYNPALTYLPPLYAGGTSYPSMSFTAAQYDGYNTASGAFSTSTGKGTVNLSTSFVADSAVPYSSGTTYSPSAAFYYVYSGLQLTQKQKDYYNTSSVFYKECNSLLGSTTKVDGVNAVNSIFTLKTVGATSGPGGTDERVNFANWYSYYRTRMQMMKSASGLAFNTLTNHFRVGFMTINNNASPAFLNISDFDSAQKSTWYTKLYSSVPNNSTPLREALANIGRMYAGKITTLNSTTVTNPVQYSCQQNYTILSTDGFWNGTDGNVHKLDGSTTMDNEDGDLPRPYYDGATVNYSKTTSQLQTSQTTASQSTSQLQTRTTQNQSDITQIQKRTVQNQTSTTQLQIRTVQNQSDTTQIQWKSMQYQKCRANGSSCQSTSYCTVAGGTGDSTRPLCQVPADPGWTNVSSCTANPTGSPAVNCQTTDTLWVNVGTCTPSSSGGKTVTCKTSSDSGWGNASSCTASNPASGPTVTCQTTAPVVANVGTCTPSSSGGQTVTCQTGSDSGWGNANSCTASNPASGPTLTCQTTDTGWVKASTCTAAGLTNGKTVACQITDTGWVGSGSCAASSSSGQKVTCNTAKTGPTLVASCTLQTAASGNSWLQITCSTATVSPATGVSSCTVDPPTSANGYVATNCNTVTTGPTSTTSCVAATASTSNNYTTTNCSVASTSGGTSDTLADVASYYYRTNLRTTALSNCLGPVIPPATTGTDLCAANKVPSNGLDTATWQHMTTFTLGLGARGRMVFSPTYLTDSSGDYFDVWKGNAAGASNCTWKTSGTTCNWPTPGADQIENVDDLWHAAVDGHGNYFSATDPGTLGKALAGSLNVIINTPQPGTAAAAATTNPMITATSNYQFSSYFASVEWSGELIRQTMSLTDGSVPVFDPLHPNPAAYDWSAQTLLDAKTYTNRTIYTRGAAGLINFTWTALVTAGLQSNFTTPNISTAPPAYPNQITGLSQFCASGSNCISTTAQTNNTIATSGAAGEALVNFLLGDRSNEEGPVTDPTKYFRHRAHVLGDIVSAQPVYVGAPTRTYTENNYAGFQATWAGRTPVVYAAANDGMLHAFDAATGDEKWAYIPSFVLPRLYTLADKNYSNKHQYFVEGTPKAADVFIGGAWKTILVGGLNGGGTGYYALDITNPTTPVLLWEYTNSNMGYTFGNPQIAEQDDGTWAVMVTSGYNNCARSVSANCVTTSGDGKGYLYVLKAVDGTLRSAISTGVGGPSGLGRIIAQAEPDGITSKRVYGGDLLGNLWRFTIQVVGSAGYSKQLLATLLDPSGNPQAITAMPQVTTFNGTPVVFVGTGRYLGTTDVGTTQQQSFYGIKDNVVATPYTTIRSDTSFIKKTAVTSTCPVGTDISICDPGTLIRTVSLNTGTTATDSLATKNGWFLDFPAGSGELEFTDPKLVHGVLAFSTSVPVASTSSVCGDTNPVDPKSFAYMLNYLTGGSVVTGDIIASTIGTGIATSAQINQLPNSLVIQTYRLSSGQEVQKVLPTNNAVGGGKTRRVSWRELVTQ